MNRYIAFSLASDRSLSIGSTPAQAIERARDLYPDVGVEWLELVRGADETRTNRLYALRIDLPLARVDPGALVVYRGSAAAMVGLEPIGSIEGGALLG